jgi:hypothetical protein
VTPWHGGPIKAFGDQGPLGEGGLYAAQIGGVGFHSIPGEIAASWGTAVKMIHETHEKKQKNLCNLRNLWFHLLIFSSFQLLPFHQSLL